MKKYLLLIMSLLFLLSGCSRVNNPYEIKKGTSTLSYYDTEDSFSENGFTIIDRHPTYLPSDNCIVVRRGMVRCIYIIDEDIITYKGISVGDNVDKIGDTFSNIQQSQHIYNVLINNNTEEDPDDPDKEDTWIWIIYYTDDSKITAIQICDVLYGSSLT